MSIVESITKARIAPAALASSRLVLMLRHQAQCIISTPEQVDRLFTFIAALVVKEEGEDSKCRFQTKYPQCFCC